MFAPKPLRRRFAIGISQLLSLSAVLSCIAAHAAEQQPPPADSQPRAAINYQELSRRHLYALHLNLAQQAWDRGHTSRVLELLNGQRPQPGQRDLRGFEWYYLRRLCDSDLWTFGGQPGTGVRYIMNVGVAFSPDGKTLAMGGREVKLLNAATGKELISLKGHTGGINCVAFSPDGRTLATAGSDRTVRLWDVAAGEQLAVLEGHSSYSVIYSLAFAPDGQTLASASSDKTVRLWDVAAKRERKVLEHEAPVRSVAFSPDGKTLASSTGRTEAAIRLWDLASGRVQAILPGHTDRVYAVAFSPDGKTLATAGGPETAPNEVKLWNMDTRQVRLAVREPQGRILSLSFSPDGKSLAVGSLSPIVKVWDPATGQLRAAFRGHGEQGWHGISSVAFSPDGKTLASAGADITVKMWDVTQKQGPTNLGGPRDFFRSVTFSPDGKTLATCGSSVDLWSAESGERLLTLQGRARAASFLARAVSFLPDGQTLATASGKTVKLWDAMTGKERKSIKGHAQTVTTLSCSPDGKILASGSAPMFDADDPGGAVKLWDAATGEELATLSSFSDGRAGITSVAFSPDGKVLAAATGNSRYSGGMPGEVRLYDTATKQLRATLRGHDRGGIYQIAFSPDGTTLATASGDRTVKLWNVDTAEQLATLKGHTHWVVSVVFASDGNTLASASYDHTVKLWDAVTGQERATLTGHEDSVNSVAFSPDARVLATAGDDRTIKLWHGSQDRPDSIEVNGSPETVAPGEMTTLTITVRAADGSPVSDANVSVSAGGGKFLPSADTPFDPNSRLHGPYSATGMTDRQGRFTTWWVCNPCARGYGLGIQASKRSNVSSRTEYRIGIRD